MNNTMKQFFITVSISMIPIMLFVPQRFSLLAMIPVLMYATYKADRSDV